MTNQADIVNAITFPDGSSPSGCMLLERVLQQLLQVAFANLKADPSTVDDLFYKLSTAERASIKNWISTQLNLVVRTNYPETGYQQPMLCIISESEEEQAQQDFLGDQMGLEGHLSDGTPCYTVGHAERCTYNIMCFAGKDSNGVLWLYYLVKAILMLNTPLLIAHGMIDPTISGRDLSFREEMLPEFTYSRVVTLSCQQVFSLYVTEAVGKTLVVQTLPVTAVKVQLTV